jgi:aminoglycoside 3-N-acetyltransferase
MTAGGKNKAQVGKPDIKAGLTRLGLKAGDSVGVHSSLSSFGYVDGGADTVIDALLETVGAQGNVVMSTHSANLSEDRRTPEMIAQGIAWLFKILPYDPDRTPVTTGRIPETFRKRQGVIRGRHPSLSVAAAGPKAAVLSKGWDQLLAHDGYILLIGVGLDRCTAMHLAEQRVQLPARILRKITPPKRFAEQHPDSEWEWDVGPYPDFAQLTQPCLDRGIMKTTQVGDATLRLVKLRALIDLYAEALERNPDAFYSTGTNPT